MPNCDFYAAGEDYRLIIEFVLAETSCAIFPLSVDNRPLVAFRSFAELQAVEGRDEKYWPPLLNLWPAAANPNIKIKHTEYPARGSRPGWWREELDGWGTIQLYLSSPRNGALSPSHTNHNSETRALNWAATYPDKEGPEVWDFAAVTRESARINRYIRKLAVDKRGSRVVLPGAQVLFASGIEAALN